jgi:hypothetical protein
MTLVEYIYTNLNEHYIGITIITISFIYLLVISLYKQKVEIKKYFLLIYSIGGFILMNKFIQEKNTYVLINEFIGASIALFLFLYSFNKHN